MECLTRFALNVFFGSLIAYFVTLFFVFIFRLIIRSPRTLYFLYILPFIKITYDLVFSSHLQWVFRHGESLLNQPENSRTLNAALGYKGVFPFAELNLKLNNTQLFSLGDICVETIGNHPSVVLGLSLIILTLCSLFRFGWQIRKGALWKKDLLNKSHYYGSFRKVPIYSAQKALKSPLLIGVWKPLILCPETLLKAYSTDEKRAVFLHENAHVFWKDNALNGCLSAATALFWFIPFKKWLLKKASFYRELACDAKGNPLHIATALKKTHSIHPPIGCIAFSSSFHRIKRALETKRPGKTKTLLSYLFLIGGVLFIMGSHFLPF